MLAIREDVDYRVIYMEERLLSERLKDVYIAMKTHKSPPVFHRILEELADIEATLFVKQRPEAFSDLTKSQLEDLYEKAKSEDYEALAHIYARMDRRFIEMFARDIVLLLDAHQYSFFEVDPWDREYTKVFHASIQSVW